MKSIIITIIVILITSIPMKSQQFEEVASITVDTQKLTKEMEYQSTQFITKSKKNTDYIFTFNIFEILKPYLAKISADDMKSLVFAFINSKGETILADYSEFDNNITNIPAVLTYKEVKIKMGDSIVLQEIDGDIDLSELDETISHFSTRNRIGLQIKTLDKQTINQMSSNATIIFPNDLTTDRWITDIVEIKIYKFKTVK